MSDINNLRRLSQKANREGVESLTDEEREELKAELEAFTHDLKDAMQPLIEAYTDVMQNFVEACQPLLEYSEKIEDESA